VHQYKYEGLFSLSDQLFGWLSGLCIKEDLKFDLITFVPLSRKRLTQRGYNQSEILAKKVSRNLGISFGSTLKKRIETKPQVGLGRKERLKNLENAYFFKGGQEPKGKTVAIIDDVITTGATLNQCAKALKAAGAKKVWGLTIAKE
jgi:competence protein ComFC